MNQIEYHPFLGQSAPASVTRNRGMAVAAYCATAVGRVLSDPTLKKIAACYERGISQIEL